jgi:hypothetical protein
LALRIKLTALLRLSSSNTVAVSFIEVMMLFLMLVLTLNAESSCNKDCIAPSLLSGMLARDNLKYWKPLKPRVLTKRITEASDTPEFEASSLTV